MPDVNLLRDTKEPAPKPKPPTPPGPGQMTDPSAASKAGIGGMFRSLFNRRPSPTDSPVKPSTGRMSIGGRSTTQERILSETKRAPMRSGVIPLPEDQGAYDVNLLTEDLVTTFNPRQKFMQLGGIVLGAAVIVVLAYVGLRYYASTVSKQVDQDRQTLTSLQQQVAGLNNEQQLVSSTTKKIGAIQSLIDRHVRWTRFFTALERYTLPTVTYGEHFTGDISGSITLTATTGTFDDVAKQYLIFEQAVGQKDFISSFNIDGASQSGSGASQKTTFTVTLTLIPTLLENPPSSVAAVPSTPTTETPVVPTTNENTNVPLNSNTAVSTNTNSATLPVLNLNTNTSTETVTNATP